jgi:hypothetical protein
MMKMLRFYAVPVFFFLLLNPNIAVASSDDGETPQEFNVKGVAGGVSATVSNESGWPNASVKEKIIQAGALEKIERDKYTLRKIQTRIEFYPADTTKFFLKTDGSAENINDRVFLEVRGPKNKKAVLANAVYIYENRKVYEEMTDRETQAQKKSFQAPLLGTLKSRDPFLVITDEDGKDFILCPDDDTIWVNNKPATRADMLAGDRLKLYFDKRLSIRYNNYPVKVIIDKSKSTF